MSSRSPRQELIGLQKKLFRQNQEIIESSIFVKERGFKLYESRYQRKIASFQSISNFDQMIRASLKADIIYVGDYHTCNQSQRSFLRFLKAIIKENSHFVLALELVHHRYQRELEQFMAGKLTEASFLRKIGFREFWIFDLWENFRPIFDFARYHQLPVCGVDAAPPNSPLQVRDRASARIIADLAEKYPDRKILVLIGDLHLAPSHLPAEVKKLNKEVRDIILYQNSPKIYWKLAAKGKEEVEIVKIDNRAFCRMHTPPVVCQQSYLNWLEHEEGEIDYSDATQNFMEIVDRIAFFLGIQLGDEKDTLEVFTSGDLSFLKRVEEAGLYTKREINDIKRQILSSESYFLAKMNYVYLGNLSLNHAAEEAAHFIKHACSGDERPRSLEDAFYANILHEALAFFGSKLINHKRKCFHESNFKELLAYLASVHIPADRALEFKLSQFVLEFLRYAKRGKLPDVDKLLNNDRNLFFASTHALGYMLGDRLFYAFMGNKIGKKALRELFFDQWEGKHAPQKSYVDLMQRLRPTKIPSRQS